MMCFCCFHCAGVQLAMNMRKRRRLLVHFNRICCFRWEALLVQCLVISVYCELPSANCSNKCLVVREYAFLLQYDQRKQQASSPSCSKFIYIYDSKGLLRGKFASSKEGNADTYSNWERMDNPGVHSHLLDLCPTLSTPIYWLDVGRPGRGITLTH